MRICTRPRNGGKTTELLEAVINYLAENDESKKVVVVCLDWVMADMVNELVRLGLVDVKVIASSNVFHELRGRRPAVFVDNIELFDRRIQKYLMQETDLKMVTITGTCINDTYDEGEVPSG